MIIFYLYDLVIWVGCYSQMIINDDFQIPTDIIPNPITFFQSFLVYGTY